MPVTLIKEDGTGKATANSYAHSDDGVIYHMGHLYASAWDAASDDDKNKALIMATRLIDTQMQFGGIRATDEQALQWPRENCPDPDGAADSGGVVASNVIPKNVRDATCEMARELLIADRTANPRGEGLKYENVGSTQTGYSKVDVPPILSHVAQAMLKKYGSLIESKSGSMQLKRV